MEKSQVVLFFKTRFTVISFESVVIFNLPVPKAPFAPPKPPTVRVTSDTALCVLVRFHCEPPKSTTPSTVKTWLLVDSINTSPADMRLPPT